MQGLFPLGQIVATPGALETLARANQTPNKFLLRHISGDWKLAAHDLADNMYSLKYGLRVMSSYRTKSGDTLWLVTEADRGSTTLLLPEEY
jgi:hypothetical protein